MPWLTSTPEILISREEYYEERNYNNDPDKPQKRLRIVRVVEYRGLTQAAAEGLVAPSETETQTIVWTAQRANEAGGYTATKTTDESSGAWSPTYIG